MSGAVAAICCCGEATPDDCPDFGTDQADTCPVSSPSSLDFEFEDIELGICMTDGTTCTETLTVSGNLEPYIPLGESNTNYYVPDINSISITGTGDWQVDTDSILFKCSDSYDCAPDSNSYFGMRLVIRIPASSGACSGNDPFDWEITIFALAPVPVTTRWNCVPEGMWSPEVWSDSFVSLSSVDCTGSPWSEFSDPAPTCSDIGGPDPPFINSVWCEGVGDFTFTLV